MIAAWTFCHHERFGFLAEQPVPELLSKLIFWHKKQHTWISCKMFFRHTKTHLNV
jgi:hypothetical protein